MKKARWISLLLTLLLFMQPLYALAEAAPPPVAPENQAAPVMTAEEAAQAERLQRALQISVDYAETDWDGMAEAIITVTWPGTEAVETAENVCARIQLRDGLYIVAGLESVELGSISAGQSAVFGVILGYDRQIERQKEKPEPTLVITAYSGNTDYTRYTAVMDGMTEPRALVVAWEDTDIGPRAMQANIDMMKDTFSKSYYNGKAFDISDSFDVINETGFESAMGRMAGWEENANDVTYVYINAHGPMDNDVPIPAFQAETVQAPVVVNGRTYSGGLIPYESLLTYLDQNLDGRVVIITEICFSGQLLDVAGQMGIDAEKFSILTAAPNNVTSQLWGDQTEHLKINLPFSYGWFTNDLCDLLDAGYAKDANGAVTVGAAYAYLSDAKTALKNRFDTALNDTNEEDLLPTDISGLNDVFDTIDVWGERMREWLNMDGGLLAIMDETEPLEYFRQGLMNAISWLDPRFAGNNSTLLYCSDPAYDNEKRLLVIEEEKWEVFSPVELYYDYLRREVRPVIGEASSNEEIMGAEGYGAEHWSQVTGTVGGLLSAAVADLDKNGTPDLLTIEVDTLSREQIEQSGRYFSVDLKLYQIVDGAVEMSDVIEDVIFVNERDRSCNSHTNFRLTEYEGRLLLECWASFTDGLSYDNGMNAFFGFDDGCFAEAPARPSPYEMNYFTVDGRAYSPSLTAYEIGYQPNGVFRASSMGEFLAYINYVAYFYPKNPGYVYHAGDYTKLYEYLYEYEPEDYFTPLSYVGQPLPTAAPEEQSADANKAAIEAALAEAAAPYQERMDSARFRYSVRYKKNGDLSQIMISIGHTSAGAIDTELLRELCMSLVSAEGSGLPADAASMVSGFEFRKGKSASAGLVEMEMNQKPSGEFVVTITNDRARK